MIDCELVEQKEQKEKTKEELNDEEKKKCWFSSNLKQEMLSWESRDAEADGMVRCNGQMR